MTVFIHDAPILLDLIHTELLQLSLETPAVIVTTDFAVREITDVGPGGNRVDWGYPGFPPRALHRRLIGAVSSYQATAGGADGREKAWAGSDGGRIGGAWHGVGLRGTGWSETTLPKTCGRYA